MYVSMNTPHEEMRIYKIALRNNNVDIHFTKPNNFFLSLTNEEWDQLAQAVNKARDEKAAE